MRCKGGWGRGWQPHSQIEHTTSLSGMVRGSPSPLPGQHTLWVVSLPGPSSHSWGEGSVLVPRSAWEPGFCKGPTPFTQHHTLVSRRWALLPSCPTPSSGSYSLRGRWAVSRHRPHACRGQTTASRPDGSAKPETLELHTGDSQVPVGTCCGLGGTVTSLGEAGSSTCLDCFSSGRMRTGRSGWTQFIQAPQSLSQDAA